jgi:group I intron endonuclease
MGYIYLITNKVNGRQYVGQSKCDDINKRWKQHKLCSKRYIGTHLYNAYIKHGIDNFIFKIICICFDEDCNKYEIEYIKKYNTLSPNGYNLTPGGHCGITHPESIEKMRESVKKSWTEERKRHFSENFSGKNATRYGMKTREETKEKLRQVNKKRWENMSKEEYERICKERKERFIGKSPSQKAIDALAKGRQMAMAHMGKGIGKYDNSGNLLETFTSISEASRKTGICHSTISRVCLGKEHCKTAGGFIWKYIK